MLSPVSPGASAVRAAAAAAAGSSGVGNGDKNDHGEPFEVVVYVPALQGSPLHPG